MSAASIGRYGVGAVVAALLLAVIGQRALAGEKVFHNYGGDVTVTAEVRGEASDDTVTTVSVSIPAVWSTREPVSVQFPGTRLNAIIIQSAWGGDFEYRSDRWDWLINGYDELWIIPYSTPFGGYYFLQSYPPFP